MKILYSQLKKLLPELKASPKGVGEVLTKIGFLMDGLEEVGTMRFRDTVISLEVRQNRADCLSAIGISRELAAYYGLKLNLPVGFIDQPMVGINDSLNIKIQAKEVRRVLALKVEGVNNSQPSPEWLTNYLKMSGMNPVNLLVDLSNYLMLVTGYPPHLFDADKVGALVWEVSHGQKTLETFDGTVVNLTGGELIISSGGTPMALAGLVGSKVASVTPETKNIIVEIANYDPAIVRENARKLRIFTEAGSRLDKLMSPSGITAAMNLMVSLIKEHAAGNVTALFGYYPEPKTADVVKLDLHLPSKLSGIDIAPEVVVEKLTALGCVVNGDGEIKEVTLPLERADLVLAEDLAEEVIRLVGYDKIPAGTAPSLPFTQDITPKSLKLSTQIRQVLCSNGYDEILSCPLVKSEDNVATNFTNYEPILAQNPINEGYPELRMGMISGLINQRSEYWKRGIAYSTLFEIGRVFGSIRGKFEEHEALAILVNWRKGAQNEIEQALMPKNLSEFRQSIEKLLRSLGLSNVIIKPYIGKIPAIALDSSCYQIFNNQLPIGLFYKVKENEAGSTYVAEINLEKLCEQLIPAPAAVEIEDKLIALDANVIVKDEDALEDFLTKSQVKIAKENLWSINVIDQYKAPQGLRYTLRITYVGLTDQAAKAIHGRIFG